MKSIVSRRKPAGRTISSASALQKLLDSSPDVICSFDAQGRFLHASAATESVWGYTPEELIGRRHLELIHPADRAKTLAAAEAIRNGVNVTSFENRYIRKDATLVPILWSARWDSQDEVMYCVAKDATEKKVLEESYENTRKLFESFMQHSPLIGWITDEYCMMQYMNPYFLRSYGLSEKDLGKSLYDLFPGQAALDYHMNNLRVIREGKAIESVERATLPDGREQIVKTYKFPLQINGRVMVAGWGVDITEQMELQTELEKSLERYHYVSEATSDAIYDWNLSTKRIYRGSGFETLFGYSNREVSIRFRLSLIHPDDVKRYKSVVFRALRDASVTNFKIEYRFRDAAGHYRDVVDKAFIIRKGGKGIRVIGTLQDITEQKQLQARLIEQEKQAKRKMVKSILEAQEKERRHLSVELHDNVNQMLTSCKLMLEFARENRDAAGHLTEKTYHCIQSVIDEIRRISHNLNPSLIEDVGLVDAIKQMIEKINAAGKLKVHFQKRVSATEFGEEDKITIYRIIQEQLCNVIKHAGATNVIIGLFAKEGRVSLFIQDDGKGFDVDNAKRGLGMKNIMHRVNHYNGTLQIHSSPGGGCRLDIRIGLRA